MQSNKKVCKEEQEREREDHFSLSSICFNLTSIVGLFTTCTSSGIQGGDVQPSVCDQRCKCEALDS